MRAFLPVFAYAALIFWLSSLPSVGIQGVPHLDKVLHLMEYGFMGVLLVRAWMHAGFSRGLAIVVLTLAAGGILAGLDELWQGTVAGRTQSLADWGTDLVGLTLAALAWPRLKRL